jgi:hypothetical protein
MAFQPSLTGTGRLRYGQEDMDSIVANCERNPVLVFPFAGIAVEQLADFVRKIVVLGGNRATERAGFGEDEKTCTANSTRPGQRRRGRSPSH